MNATDDLQPDAAPRRSRTTSLALLGAGSVAGLVLGFSGLASAADGAPSTGSATVQQSATTDEGAPSTSADPLCDHAGGGQGTGGTAPGTTEEGATGGTSDENV